MQLQSVAAYQDQMAQARRAGALLTNFYPTPDKVQRWIEGGTLLSARAGGVQFFLRRDRDFLHVSYVTSHGADLAGALRELVGSTRETLTVDLLGKAEQVAALAVQFAAVGFAPRCVMHRMTRTTDGTAAAEEENDPEVTLAKPDDAPALVAMLEGMLDHYAESLPDIDEMRRAAADRKILVIRAGTAIAGMLFYDVTGQSSLLRHWVVDSAHRDRRIGARLMHRYFADCKDVRRFTLWVISNNDNAINRYKHYGYQDDVLVDHVLMRQPS